MKSYNYILPTLVLALCPVLDIYLVQGLPIYWFAVALSLPFCLGALNIRTLGKRKTEIQWFFLILVLSFIGFLINTNESWFSDTLFFHNLVSISVSFLALIILTLKVDYKLFLRAIITIGLIASVICIYQRISLIITGDFYRNFYLPGLEVSQYEFVEIMSRPMAIFREPAHLCIYLLPILYLMLSKRNYLFGSIVGLGVLSSGSTTGFIMLFVILLWHFIDTKAGFLYIMALVVITVLFAFGIITFYPEIILENIDKLNETESDNIRLFGGVEYIEKMDGIQKIVGIGLNQCDNFLKVKGMLVGYNGNYANSLLFSIISYGYIGFLFFVIYLCKLWKKYKLNRGFEIILISILASDQILFNAHLVYLLTFVLLIDQSRISRISMTKPGLIN